MTDSESGLTDLELITEEFIKGVRRGENPRVSEYVKLYPDHADQIRAFFPALMAVEKLKPSVDEALGDHPGPIGAGRVPREYIGDYRILREVGRGGMGIVYEAEQQSLGRRVALKILNSTAILDGRHLSRFNLEARTAARLHHTNIVPVFGVGEENGLHYYAMQFISGLGLDQVLDELRRTGPAEVENASRAAGTVHRDDVSRSEIARSLLLDRSSLHQPARAIDTPDTERGSSTGLENEGRERPPEQGQSTSLLGSGDSNRHYARNVAALGAQIAEALEYAHEQGVLHRDVKPSNLLLDVRANVWVTDFGLAKASDTEDLTDTGDIVGTIRYMAPERLSGQCDHRSDIYSLGLTLYELLARRPAFASSDRNVLMKQVIEAEPARLRSIDRSIPRDLETIVHKAIEKSPDDRYTTAESMARDLRSFLEDRPVEARRVRSLERAIRWARRNPLPAGLVATVFLLLAAIGIISSTLALRLNDESRRVRQARREAETNFQSARKAVDQYFTLVSEETLLNEPSLIKLREKLLRAALDYHRDFLRTRGAHPALRAELAESYLRAGSVLGQLGERDQALQNFSEAKRLYSALASESPGRAEFRRGLADSLLRIATTRGFAGAQPDDVSKELEEARALCERLRAEDREDIVSRHFLVTILNLSARLKQNSKELNVAIELCRRSRDVVDEIVQIQPDSPRNLSRMAEAHRNLGSLEGATGNPPEGILLCERSIAILEPLVKQDPRSYAYRHGIGKSLEAIAAIHSGSGDAVRSVRFYDDAGVYYESLARERPENPRFRNDHALVLIRSAAPLTSLGRAQDARDRTDQAAAILREILSRDDQNMVSRKLLDECQALQTELAHNTPSPKPMKRE